MKYSIGSITTVKEELDVIVKFTNYHLNFGVSFMVIFLDDFSGTLEYLFDERCTVIITDERYWKKYHGTDRPDSIEERQLLNLSYGLTLLKEKISHVIHLDIDELLYMEEGDLQKILFDAEAFGCDSVFPEVVEIFPRGLNIEKFYESAYFKKQISLEQFKKLEQDEKNRIDLQNLLAPKVRPNNYFKGHTISKGIIKIDDNLDSLKIHSSNLKQGIPKSCDNGKVKLLHFYSINYKDWYQKWERRITMEGKADGLIKKRRIFQEMFKIAYVDKKTEELFLSTHCLPEKQLKLLQKCNWVEKIELDDNMFLPKWKKDKS
jgi:hypothetical protein